MVVKFHMWSPFHYFMIIFPFILSIILYYLLKGKSQKKQQYVSIILSIIMVFIFIMRSINMIIKHDGLNPEVFPFQICHMANFIFLLAAISKNKVWGSIAWILNVPAGLVSVIFADGLERYQTIVNIQGFAYIAGHMLIVTTGVYMFLMRQIVIRPKTFRQTIVLVGIMYLASVFINNLFNAWFRHTGVPSNYFYSLTPERGTPLEMMFNLGKNIKFGTFVFNPIYLLLLAFVGLVVMSFMYSSYQIGEITRRR